MSKSGPQGAPVATVPDEGIDTLAARAARRPLGNREAAYTDEVNRLLDAGMALMQRSGTESSPRVADIVREAGLSNYVFYRHFASKHDLVAAIVERGLHGVISYLEHQMSKETDPEAKIGRWVEGVMRQAGNEAAAHTARAVMWNDDQLAGPARMHTLETRGLLASLLEAPLTEAGSDDPARDTTTIAATAMARMEDFLFRGDIPQQDDIDHLVSFCLAGIRRR